MSLPVISIVYSPASTFLLNSHTNWSALSSGVPTPPLISSLGTSFIVSINTPSFKSLASMSISLLNTPCKIFAPIFGMVTTTEAFSSSVYVLSANI